MCSQCDDKFGCKIYETRPQSCIDFKCSWLLDDNMSVDLRPDKCNIIFEKVTDEVEIALLHFNHLDASEDEKIKNHIKTLNENGKSVFISSFTTEPKKCILSNVHTEEYINNIVTKKLNKINVNPK